MNKFEKGDRVIVTDVLPLLVGEMGTVRDPEHQGYVIIDPDNDKLKHQVIGCFLEDELEKLL